MAHQIHRYSAPSDARSWRVSSPERDRTRRQDDNRPTDRTSSVTAKAVTFDAQVKQSGRFKVTTDDGDQVSISLSALRQLHAESFEGESGDAKIDYNAAKSTNQVSVAIRVNGSLDDDELADITQLLGQLAANVNDSSQGVSASQLEEGGDFSSISSFQFAYRERIKASYSESEASVQAPAQDSRQKAYWA